MISDKHTHPSSGVGPGTKVAGRYVITGPLGGGGMGVVFAGHDLDLDRPVAIKLLPPGRTKDRRAGARFLREARAMARVVHPASVQVFDHGRDARAGPFLVMERLDGEDLARFLRARGPLPEALGLAVAAQICATVQTAHEAGVVHRDLKPANIFVLRHAEGTVPTVKLLDFGAAKLHDDDSALTDPGDILGTLAYMAPERWGARSRADVRADVYALGAIVYEMLTGQPPFQASTRAALRFAIINDPPPPLRDRRPDLPAWFATVVDRALDKRPERRHASASAFAAALGVRAPATAGARAGSDEFQGTTRYRVVRRLARGPQSAVYAAHDTERNRAVAIKVWDGPGGEGLFRLKREFRAAARVRHPNLVRLDALIGGPGTLMLVMELVEGVPLLQYAGAAEDRLRASLAQLARGLSVLHAQGLAHRDVKPQNALVEPSGRLVLLDCGLAARFGRAGGVRGTAGYLAPEALEGHVGPEGDLYALGVILGEWLTGASPATDLAVPDLRRAERLRPRPGVPSDLVQLGRRLLASDPAGRPTAEAIVRALEPFARVPSELAPSSGPGVASADTFIARDEILDALAEALADTAGGSPRFLWLEGPSGIGKTALLDHFRRRLEEDGGALVLSGRAREGESIPFPALDEAMDDLGSHLLGLPAAVSDLLVPRRCGALGLLFPTLTRLPSMAAAATAPDAETEPGQLRRLASDSLRELWRRLADRQPVVLIVDDLQWLDADSASLLARVFGGAGAPPMLVVGALRAGDQSPDLRRFEASLPQPAQRVALGPLSQRDCCALLRARWRGAVPLAARPAARLARLSGGVPFLAELLASGPAPVAKRAANLKDVLLARHRQLPASARRALELLCVSSRPLRAALLLDASGAGADAGALDPLFAGTMVRFTRTELGWAIEPYHGRIRESILANLSPAARRAHHRRLADQLLVDPQADAEAAVEQLAGCGETRAAAQIAMRAAAAANDQLAFDRAAVLFAVALKYGRHARDQRVAILRRQALALQNAGRRREAGAVLLRAARAARDRSLKAALRREAGAHLLLSGDVKGGLGALGPALRRAGLPLPRDLAQIVAATGAALAALGARGLGFPAAAAGAAPALLLERIDLCLDLAQGLAHIDLRALPFACLALHAALDAGEPHRLQRACAVFVINTVEYVPTPLVGPVLEICRQLTAAADSPYARALFDAALAESAHFDGNFLAAEAAFERAERTLLESCVGATRELATVRDLAVFLQYSQKGDFKSQLPRTQRWLAQAEAAQDAFHAGMLRVAHAIVWIAHDQPERARSELRRAQDAWTGTGGVLEVAVALYHDIIDRYQGDERALANSGAARSALLRSPAAQTPFLSGYLGLQRAWRLLRAMAVGPSPPGAEAGVRETIAGLRALQLTIWSAVADALEANLDFLLGQRERSLRGLDCAEQAFRRLHMLCLAACARKRRGQLVQGELGARWEAEADGELRGLGVVDPEKWAAAYWSMFDAGAALLRTQQGQGQQDAPSSDAGAELDTGAPRRPPPLAAR